MGIIEEGVSISLEDYDMNKITKGPIMNKVEETLPKTGSDVICFGIDEDGETKVEEGFRSEIDDDKKPHEWADFSFTVLYWIYSPVIENL